MSRAASRRRRAAATGRLQRHRRRAQRRRVAATICPGAELAGARDLQRQRIASSTSRARRSTRASRARRDRATSRATSTSTPPRWRATGARGYCWRGGQRSQALARSSTRSDSRCTCSTAAIKPSGARCAPSSKSCSGANLVVLCGRTGSGKSRMLQAWHARRPDLDLEARLSPRLGAGTAAGTAAAVTEGLRDGCGRRCATSQPRGWSDRR